MNKSKLVSGLVLILLTTFYLKFVKRNSQEDLVKGILFSFNDIIIKSVYRGNRESFDVTLYFILDKPYEADSRE